MTLVFSKNINVLFETVSQELKGVNEWFYFNKLSLNTGKIKFLLFHKQRVHDNTTLKLPTKTLNYFDIN